MFFFIQIFINPSALFPKLQMLHKILEIFGTLEILKSSAPPSAPRAIPRQRAIAPRNNLIFLFFCAINVFFGSFSYVFYYFLTAIIIFQ